MKYLAEGLTTSQVAIIGGRPDNYSISRNRPFSGQAGNALDINLRKAGMHRAGCYLMQFFTGTKADLHYIIHQLEAKIILLSGEQALNTMLNFTGIDKYRGSVYIDPEFPDKLFIPTYDLSRFMYIAEKDKVVAELTQLLDLKKANRYLTEPFHYTERNIILSPSFEEAISYIEEAKKSARIGFDIESKRTKVIGKFTDWEITCFSIATSSTSAICIPLILSSGANYFTEDQEVQLWIALKELLEGPGTVIIQNSMYDAAFLLKKYNILITNIEDTMVAQAILTPDMPKDLGFLCSLYTKEPYYKDDGKQHIKANSVDTDFWLYNAKDSAVLFEILDSQIQSLDAQGNMLTYEKALKVIPALLYMGYLGISVDLALKKECSETLGVKLEETIKLFKDICGDINPFSPKQLKEYFYVTKKLPSHRNRKTGTITVDEKALKAFASNGIKEASLLLEIRALAKQKTTYMDMALDSDGRMRTSFNVVGTTTGRLSSRKSSFGTGGNLQNLVKAYKKCLLADPDNFFFELDLSQAENRIVAYCSPEPKMIDAFETGKDVHSLTGALISGLTVEEVQEQNKKGIYAPIAHGNKTWRYWGKTANHSLNYGLAARGFALRVEISLRDATAIRDKYYEAYSGLTKYHRWITEEVYQNKGFLTNPFGRKRLFMGDQRLAAYATFPQSTVADIINRRGLIPLYENQEIFYPISLLTQVHDSIGFQCNYEIHSLTEIARALLALKLSLEQPITWRGSTFIIPLEAKFGTNFADLTTLPLDSIDGIVAVLEEAKGKLRGTKTCTA